MKDYFRIQLVSGGGMTKAARISLNSLGSLKIMKAFKVGINMKQKYYLILVMIAMIGAIFSGCVQQEKPTPEMALAPYVEVEATVTSLFLDDLQSDCQKPEVCPRDRITLRIDNIDRTGDPNNFTDLIVGDEVVFNIRYSARPAKLRGDLPPSCRVGEVFKSGSCVTEGCEGPECKVSSPQYAEKPAEVEGNYIIYHLPQRTDEITEKILPGLEENSKIKIRIGSMSKEIEEYELI